jgi:UDPglucose--hexose-1-phosphate uridylyltransferase
MTTLFKNIKTTTRLRNPFKDFALDEIPSEIRFDPLTGQTGRIFDLSFKAEPTDWSGAIQQSREMFCPFCPETLEKSTPLFPEELVPEGRLRIGEATLIPNLVPFDKYAGVAVMTEQHYVAIQDWTAERLKDAFSVSRAFIRRVAEQDPEVNFFSVNWNFMPPAGSSIVHPHLQANCGEVPTNEHRLQMEGCRKYRREHARPFWRDFMETERANRERFIGESGTTFWVLNYVPLGFLPDVWCVFPEHAAMIDLGDEEMAPFLRGLSATLRYFSRIHVSSFNVSIFSVREDEDFRMNARICPRLLPRPIGNSDIAYLQMIHREPFCVKFPESVCEDLRAAFET